MKTIAQGSILILLSTLTVLGTGCAALTPQVTTTKVHYDRTAGIFILETPKDNIIKGFHVKRDASGELLVDLDSLEATVNPGALAAAQAEASHRAQLTGLLAQALPAALGRPIPPLPAPAREPSSRPAGSDDETPSVPK